jgi:hypothetical protein
MKSKTDDKFLTKWRNFAGKKWKYVFVEGLLKQGIMFAVSIYILTAFALKYIEPSYKNIAIFLLLMPVFQIPLSLFLYKKFQHYYLELINQPNTENP